MSTAKTAQPKRPAIFDLIFSHMAATKAAPIPFSPAEPGDEVVGTISKETLDITAYIYEMEKQARQVAVAYSMALDQDTRTQLRGELQRVQAFGACATTALNLLIVEQLGKWGGANLTIRAGGVVVITPEDRRIFEMGLVAEEAAVNAAAEEMAGGSPNTFGILHEILSDPSNFLDGFDPEIYRRAAAGRRGANGHDRHAN